MRGDDRRRRAGESVERGRRAVRSSDGLLILETVGGATLTDDDVSRLRDDLQR